MTLSRGTKFLVTGVMLLLAASALFGSFPAFDAFSLGSALLFALIAAAPWIDPKRPGRAGGLVVLGFAAAFAFYGYQILTGLVVYPRECTGRRLFCDVVNFLYGIGGRPAASAPLFALAAALIYGGIKALRRNSAA